MLGLAFVNILAPVRSVMDSKHRIVRDVKTVLFILCHFPLRIRLYEFVLISFEGAFLVFFFNSRGHSRNECILNSAH